MAIKPDSLFTGKIAAASTDYPLGSARNVTTPGDGTGTPFVADLLNDTFGFQQAILSEAGITPSQSPDTAVDSQYLSGLTALLAVESFDTFSALEASTRTLTGSEFVCRERANANYILQASGYIALAGDATFANGRVAKLQINGVANILKFGGKGDDAFDNTVAMASALSRLSIVGDTLGGKVYFPSGIHRMDGFSLPTMILIEGESRGSAHIKLNDGANEDLMTVPASCDQSGWSKITFNGNKDNNTSGNGIFFVEGVGNNGNSFSPFNDKAQNAPYSYKQVIATDFAVGNCAGNGIYSQPSNFQIFMDNFAAAHNGLNGIWIRSSDGIYSNFYAEKNGSTGLYASGSANKFSNFKAIWNGRTVNTLGGWRDQGAFNQYTSGEAQDNYCDGIQILGKGSAFVNCSSNTNGYLSVANPISSGVNYDILIGASADKFSFDGEVHTYKTEVGTDGLWVTQEPYHFNSYSDSQTTKFVCPFDPDTYNALPNVIVSKTIGTEIHKVSAVTNNGSDVFCDTDVNSPDLTGDQILRFFRSSGATTGLTRIIAYLKGTSTETTEIRDTGYTNLSKNDGGPVIIGGPTTGGRWDTGTLRLGPIRIWADDSDKLRLKVGSDPSSNTDGTIIGTQS